jgi:purine-nucleoside phosphorylase
MSLTQSTPDQAARIISKASRLRPTLAIVLGSGFGSLVEKVIVEVEIPYEKLPGFPRPAVSGHAGRLIIGKLAEVPVIILSGRAHFYEGHEMSAVTFAVRTMAALGIRDLMLTNAAGGINSRFRAGDFMALKDHINFMGTNPLRGPHFGQGPRFVDMTTAYDPGLRKLLWAAGKKAGARLHEGVYLGVSGPSYETPAEITAFERLGADAVGMSTVPEAIVARQCGMKVAGISCITNLAAGRGNAPLSHAEVLDTAEKVKKLATELLEYFARLYGSKA